MLARDAVLLGESQFARMSARLRVCYGLPFAWTSSLASNPLEPARAQIAYQSYCSHALDCAQARMAGVARPTRHLQDAMAPEGLRVSSLLGLRITLGCVQRRITGRGLRVATGQRGAYSQLSYGRRSSSNLACPTSDCLAGTAEGLRCTQAALHVLGDAGGAEPNSALGLAPLVSPPSVVLPWPSNHFCAPALLLADGLLKAAHKGRARVCPCSPRAPSQGRIATTGQPILEQVRGPTLHRPPYIRDTFAGRQ